MKMKQAYEQNSALGDPASVEGQLAENGHKMEKFQTELKRFQNLLTEVIDGKPFTPSAQKKSHRNSISEDSLSRSASESSVTLNNNNNSNSNLNPSVTTNNNHRSSNSLQAIITHNKHNNHDISNDNNE